MNPAVCLVVRNEAASIREWLAFHHVVGFAACIVIDHESTDDTYDQAQQAGRTQDVRLHQLRGEVARHPDYQTRAYMDVCRMYAGEFSHIAFLDSDELLVPHRPLRDLLNVPGEVSQISVPWAIFGSSGHVVSPAGLMCESYTNRALPSFEPCRHVKSIVRPLHVDGWPNPHAAHVRGMTRLPDGSPAPWGRLPGYLGCEPSYDVAQVSHYFVRSRQHWEARMARSGRRARTWEDFAVYDRGEVEDLSAAQHKLAVRRQITTTLPWTLARELEAVHD